MIPREARLAVEPSPVTATTITRAIATTTTSASSSPTAAELIQPTRRVEAMAGTAWTSSTPRVMTRAVSSSAAMPARGMNA